MRILIVSDIHGNRAALDAINEPHDVCLCIGDLVEYGPDPTACIQWARENALVTVRGNHDHGAAQNVAIQGVSGFRYLTMATRGFTIDALSETDRKFLASLPTSKMLTLDGKRYFLVHASPRDPLDEYVPQTEEAWEARIQGLDVDFVCVGHTHQQFTMQVGKTTILNSGSVGLSRDGDPRCRYAIIEDGQIELKQVKYDIERTVEQVEATTLTDHAKHLLIEVYRNGQYVHCTGNCATGSCHTANHLALERAER